MDRDIEEAHAVIDESDVEGREGTLLLVEDDPDDVMLVKEFLSESRHATDIGNRWTVMRAERLEEAVSLLEEQAFDLALVDLGLPDSKGLESFRTVREVAGDLPVIILTGRSDDRYGAEAIREGALDYVSKQDLTPTGLRRTIVHALERHRLQEEIRRRGEMLRRMDRIGTIGRLAGGVAHEFNNILTLIKGYASILRDADGLTEDQREYVREILEGAHRSAEITNELLSFSRRQEDDPGLIDLNDVCEGALGLIEPLLTREYSLEFEGFEDPAFAFIDRGLLEQSIVNVILNGRDAMPRGGRITVRCRSVDDDLPSHMSHLDSGKYGLIEIEDGGGGMTEETLERARDPFFTTKEVGDGTGLGLSQVEGYVDQCGGGLDIETERGVRTIVRLYVPLSDETPDHRQNGDGVVR